MASITLTDDMRVGAVGRTRCGKTFFFERMLSGVKNVLVIDNKFRVNWKGYSLTNDPTAALAGIASGRKVIYRPIEDVPKTFWEQALEILNEAGGGVIYIDEMPEIGGPNSMPAGLRKCFRLGGELGVGVWWAGQESTGVPNTAIRQSDVLCLFMNQGASDRDKIIKTAGDIGEVTAYLKRFEFVVYESGGDGYDPGQIPVYRAVP